MAGLTNHARKTARISQWSWTGSTSPSWSTCSATRAPPRAELSRAVGLSPSPCHRRLKLLEEAGIITGYVALLDQEKVGLPVNAFVSVELTASPRSGWRSSSAWSPTARR